MTSFFRDGNAFKPVDEAKLNLVHTLPGSNFIIAQDRISEQLYFEQVDPFTLPSKLYGDTNRYANRILNTFADRSSSTGVLLAGEKGSGKTLLAKTLSVYGANLNYPTIVVNQPWVGDEFNKLIQDIHQPAIVFFDEFEKTYDSEKQELLLTLLDGVFPSKKLFILTCNDPWRVDAHMRNRPGRIFYSIDFKGLSDKFIREYCTDNLLDTQYVDQVCQAASMFSKFNFDMLKALIEEMNRYNESAHDALELLNTKPQDDSAGRYTYSLIVNGSSVKELEGKIWNINPLAEEDIELYFSMKNNDSTEDSVVEKSEDSYVDQLISSINTITPPSNQPRTRATFTQSDLKQIDPNRGRIVYVNQGGDILVFTKTTEITYDYRSALF